MAPDVRTLAPAAMQTILAATGVITEDAGEDTGETYRFVSGPSPLDGQKLTRYALGIAVYFECDRYGYGDTLGRALRVGHMLYGAGSFCLLEGFGAVPNLGYMVVGLDKRISWSDFEWHDRKKGPLKVAPAPVTLESQFQDDAGHYYVPRAIACVEGSELADVLPDVSRDLDPPRYLFASTKVGDMFLQLHADTRGPWSAIPDTAARMFVFGRTDTLIGSRAADDLDMFELSEVAEQLGKLDATAFAVIDDVQTRTRYLEMLVAAWTTGDEERAIVELFKSVRKDEDLDTLLTDDLKTQLVTDLDKELWTMLAVVGQRFGSKDPLTAQELAMVMTDLFGPPFSLISIEGYDADGWPKIRFDLLDEFWIAAEKLVVDMPSDIAEGIWGLLTEPQKLVEGMYQLVKMAVMVQLANLGVPSAQAQMQQMIMGLATRIFYALRGAERLELTGRVMKQVKWAVIWEVVSWFVGIGEIKAAITGAKEIRAVVEGIGAVSRAAHIAGVADDAAQVAKIRKLGELLNVEKKLGAAEEGTRMIGLLPEEDVIKLAAEAKDVPLEDVSKIGDLVEYAHLQDELLKAADNIEVIRELERVMGPLDEAAGSGWQKLKKLPWWYDTQPGREEFLDFVRRLTGSFDKKLISPDELEVFFRAVDRIPSSAIESGVLKNAFFYDLAREPKVGRFIMRSGYDGFAVFYEQAPTLKGVRSWIEGLEAVVAESSEIDKAAEWNRLMQKVVAKDAEVLATIDKARPKLGGLAGWMPGAANHPPREDFLKMSLRDFLEKSEGMNPGERGRIIEELAHPDVLKEFPNAVQTPTRQRLTVYLEENPQLTAQADPEILKTFEGRKLFQSDDCIVEPDGVWILDTKGYFGDAYVGGKQLDFYEQMVKSKNLTVWIGDATTGEQKAIKGFLYVFPKEASATVNKSTIFKRGGSLWHYDEAGKLVKVPKPK